MTDQKESFSKWYQANKEKLAEARKQRYHSDPEYRARAIQHARATRARKATARTEPTGEYGITLPELLDNLGVSPWQFAEWRRRNYFPEPRRFGREVRFTERQQTMIGLLRERLSGKRRLSETETQDLKNTVELTYANWNS